MCARIGWFSINHLHRRDTERPDVRLEVISSLLDNLWRHPEGRTDECVPLRFDIGELCRDSEVCQFNLASMREKNVCRLDVSMDLSFVMQIVQT